MPDGATCPQWIAPSARRRHQLLRPAPHCRTRGKWARACAQPSMLAGVNRGRRWWPVRLCGACESGRAACRWFSGSGEKTLLAPVNAQRSLAPRQRRFW